VRSNLTLNLGLRFEHEFPNYERFNRSVDGFNFSATNPISAAATVAYATNPIPQIPVSQFVVPGVLHLPIPTVEQSIRPLRRSSARGSASPGRRPDPAAKL
jgi:hypothetical protein